MALPTDFNAPTGCNLQPSVKPGAMVIKGNGKTRIYNVICVSAAPATLVVTHWGRSTGCSTRKKHRLPWSAEKAHAGGQHLPANGASLRAWSRTSVS